MGASRERQARNPPHRRQGRRDRSPPPPRHHLVFPRGSRQSPKTSRVTFEIEPAARADFHELVAASTRLTVTHDELDSDSQMLKSISNGWPIVLSGLKTLLETGKTLF